MQKDLEEKVKEAVELALDYGQTDGAHHKMWVIDQMLQTLLGEEEYEKTIDEFCYDEEDDEFGDYWDKGTPP